MKHVSSVLLAGVVCCAFVDMTWAADSAKYKEEVVWSFGGGTDGSFPQAGLVDVKGVFYGTTSNGGSGCEGPACGTVFALDPSTGAEKVLYSFCSQDSCSDGAQPTGNLLDVNGTLYGTTYRGGTNLESEGGCGTVFALNLNTGAETVVHSFGSGSDGVNPYSNLIKVNGKLYGTTVYGGTYSTGTVFSLDPKTGTETALYSFGGNGADGSNPDAGLIALKGALYGTTYLGGDYGWGTAFSLDPKTGAEKVLHSFGYGTDGLGPRTSLLALDGTLHGTTADGGEGTACDGGGCGTVFSLDPGTGAETVQHSFAGGTDGATPMAGLIRLRRLLYGTTSGGPSGKGTVYSIDPTTGAEKVLYSFCALSNCTDGANPLGGLMNAKGVLYGTSSSGGAHDSGTVFALAKQ